MPSKKIRFEVFKRDKFTCQYCGRPAPEVILQVDHIDPKSKGGEDDILNLITSCFDCNSGKSNRTLSDDTVVIKRKQQLDQLQDRREQLDMLLEWHKELLDFEETVIIKLANFWEELAPSYHLTDNGADSLKRYVKRFGVNEVIEAMKISTSQYLLYDHTSNDPSIPTNTSVEKAFQYIPRICATQKNYAEKPYLKRMYYIRGILRNRINYVNEWQAIQLMEQAYLAGMPIENIEQLAKEIRNWSQFKSSLENYCEEQ